MWPRSSITVCRGSERVAYSRSRAERWLFAELSARTARIQLQLRRRGVQPGHRVAVMLPKSVDHIALIYALILSGAVWVPVNVRLRGAGLSHVVRHSRPELLIFDPAFEEAVSELPGISSARLDTLLGAPDPSNRANLVCAFGIAPLDPLCIIYTSGTTGPAKRVVFTHRMLRVASEAALMVADIHPGDRGLPMGAALPHRRGADADGAVPGRHPTPCRGAVLRGPVLDAMDVSSGNPPALPGWCAGSAHADAGVRYA